jgi:hypothetical protein
LHLSITDITFAHKIGDINANPVSPSSSYPSSSLSKSGWMSCVYLLENLKPTESSSSGLFLLYHDKENKWLIGMD